MKYLNYSGIARQGYPWPLTEGRININGRKSLADGVQIKSEQINEEPLHFRKLNIKRIF